MAAAVEMRASSAPRTREPYLQFFTQVKDIIQYKVSGVGICAIGWTCALSIERLPPHVEMQLRVNNHVMAVSNNGVFDIPSIVREVKARFDVHGEFALHEFGIHIDDHAVFTDADNYFSLRAVRRVLDPYPDYRPLDDACYNYETLSENEMPLSFTCIFKQTHVREHFPAFIRPHRLPFQVDYEVVYQKYTSVWDKRGRKLVSDIQFSDRALTSRICVLGLPPGMEMEVRFEGVCIGRSVAGDIQTWSGPPAASLPIARDYGIDVSTMSTNCNGAVMCPIFASTGERVPDAELPDTLTIDVFSFDVMSF